MYFSINLMFFGVNSMVCTCQSTLSSNGLTQTYSLQISVKLTKEVFLAPTRTTWGGFITSFFLCPLAQFGLFCLMMLKILSSNQWSAIIRDTMVIKHTDHVIPPHKCSLGLSLPRVELQQFSNPLLLQQVVDLHACAIQQSTTPTMVAIPTVWITNLLLDHSQNIISFKCDVLQMEDEQAKI